MAFPLAAAVGAAVAGAHEAASMLALTLACGVALVFLVRLLEGPDSEDPVWARVLPWTLAAFAVHLLLSVVINAAIYEQSDARTYHNHAVEIVRHWQSGFPLPHLPEGKEGFYYLLAGLFRVFGPNDFAGLVVNATLAAALVPITTDLTRRVLGPAAAGYVPQLVLLLPGLLLWTSQLLKEAAVIFLVASCLNAASRLLSRLSLSSMVVLALGLALLFTMRSHVALVIAMGIMLGIALGRPSVLGGLGAGASALALIALLITATGVGYSGYSAAVGADLEQANVVRKDLATSANSGFGSDIDISTPQGALANLPPAGVTFLIGPFPWQFNDARQLIALPDVLAWWVLLPSLWRGLRSASRRIGRAVLIFVLPALTTTALLSLVVGNFGTVVRERSQVVIMLVPLLAVGLAERARRAGGDETQDPDDVRHDGPRPLQFAGERAR